MHVQHIRVQAVNMLKHAVHYLTSTFPPQTPYTFQLHSVNAVIEPITGKEARVKQLIAGKNDVQDSKIWHNALAHEIVRLA